VSRFAQHTQVPEDRSRNEIERTLARYGADQFLYGWQEGAAVLGFRMSSRYVRFTLQMPRPEDVDRTERGRHRQPSAIPEYMSRERKRRWRALALVIKAKLEAVQSGIAVFEEEFLAYIVLPDKRTVGQFMLPQVEKAYAGGKMPALLPGRTD